MAIRGDKQWTRLAGRLALSDRIKDLEQLHLSPRLLLRSRAFKSLVVAALQADLFNGDAYWIPARLMHDVIDEWLMENE